ncbi:MAG: hybrid sensor histidine kinase/response regulator [Ignavibacteriales bacterium]|nr:hybrid sensor histidine kinase/response regulator [Ignavibacteriales bacterium]
MKSTFNTILNDHLIPNENIFFASWSYEGKFKCTDAFELKIGYTKDEISKLPYKHHSLIESDSEEEIYNSLVEFQSNNNSSDISKIYKLISKSEKPIWLKEIIFINRNNGSEIFSSIIVDITDVKQKEINLNEIIQRKTEQNNSKDKLISIISHDLRAPFTSLLGFSEILLNEPELPNEERVEYLKYIHDASELQLQMVNHLLDWTRFQTGTMRFEPQRIEIRDVIQNCISVLTGAAMRKNIEIKVDGGKGIFVNVDEKLISQAVTNLLSNAVKFTPSGKNIEVIISNYKNDMVEVTVKDEGLGISESNQSKLFKVETKFSQTGTAGEKGTGLGLTLVKEIIEKHSGKIWFYSELKKGSEFHFTIPKSENTLLIIEEHKDLQKEYTKVLKEQFPSFAIDFAKTGFEALNYLLEKTPSVIITYHNMSLMSGVQLVSSLRKKDQHNKVEVIVLVDKITDEEKLEYKKYKVTNFVNFNSSPIEIAEVLNSLIS